MKKQLTRNSAQTINLVELIEDMSEEMLIALHNHIVDRLNLLQRQRTRQSRRIFARGMWLASGPKMDKR